jgi:hypothetical protein
MQRAARNVSDACFDIHACLNFDVASSNYYYGVRIITAHVVYVYSLAVSCP